MVLKYKTVKSNGLFGGGFWYVASVYLDEHRQPNFTISMDKKRARQFTPESAKKFNDKFTEIGMIDKPFKLSEN